MKSSGQESRTAVHLHGRGTVPESCSLTVNPPRQAGLPGVIKATMLVLSVSSREIKMHMAFEFICLASFIYTSEFIFFVSFSHWNSHTNSTIERGRTFFKLAADVSSANSVALHAAGLSLFFILWVL